DYSTTSGSAYLRQLVGEKISLLAQVNAGSYQSSQHDVEGNDQSKFSNAIAYRRATLSGFFHPAQSFQVEIGVNRTRYEVSPGELEAVGVSIVKPEKLAAEQGEETSFFLHNQWQVGKQLELMAGVRYTIYRSLGADQIYLYQPGAPKMEETIVDSTQFSSGEKIASYSGWEPRFSLRFELSENGSVKLGYNRSFQYLNQISNTAAAAPVDVWQLSNRHVEPQHADNFSIGYEHLFKANALRANLTVFYRRIHKLLEFKDFAQLLLNDHLETELLQGKGKAHGVEVYLQKKQGRSQFELNYTWSRTLRQVAATAEQEAVSFGNWYPSNFDKPHNLNFNYHFQARPKSALSINFTYSTGRPTTAPISIYGNQNLITIPVYSERNQFRIPDYHRLDFAWTIGPWGRRDRWQNSLTFSLYNVYFRKNAFSIFFRQQPGQGVEAYRVAVLGTVFPAVTYDFKF
ncbi:MAG: TonB-dependent receptor, partial [Bacteroidota bacterium]